MTDFGRIERPDPWISRIALGLYFLFLLLLWINS